MERIAYFLDVDINQVVYLRRDNKVVAAKYLGFVNTRISCTKHRFERADGKLDIVCVSNGYTKGYHYGIFPTIEDAIQNTNVFDFRLEDITQTLIENLGFTHEYSFVGRKNLGLAKWYWDSFQPKREHIYHDCFDIIFNGEWKCKHVYGSVEKYYDTDKECRESNHVDVVTF